ncbi:MAG: DNA repair protein RecO [Deltaproteobacteria bacterium]|nr:DNA repair protein RecO [Deltaproteobacteria bacterium]
MITKTTHKNAAIVLKTLDYGESDRIVTLYTADFGKIKGIAKGARRSRKRFANTLEPFSCAAFLFSKRGDNTLAFLEDSDNINHYPAIRADLEKTLLASYLVDLTDQFTLEGKTNKDLFSLIIDFLGLMDAGEVSDALMRFFEMRLLKYSGYEPVLDHCTICRQPVESMAACRFSFAAGGISCNSCYNNSGDCLPVSLGTVKTLLMGKDMEPAQIHRLSLSIRSAEESRQMLAGFIRHLLGKELKSARVINEIRRLGI